MKKIVRFFYGACLALVPACAALMLTAVTNSTSCWTIGQEELPTGAKKYRKF